MKLYVTTGEAAEIVNVHESTVKRWCDASSVSYDLTAGGHRRVEFDSLMAHAAANGLECELLPFGAEAGDVFKSLRRIRSDDDFKSAVELGSGWLEDGQTDLLSLYFTYLHHQAVTCPDIFDRVVQPAMESVGHGWEEGELGVGDEHRMSNVLIDALYAFRSVLRREGYTNGRSAVVACMEGNRHDIGANMARIILENAGWNVIYLGADVPLHEVVLQQRIFDSAMICLSTAKPQVAADAVRSTRVLSKMYEPGHPYRLVIGGAPVRWLPKERAEALPFDAYRTFVTLKDFDDWLQTVSAGTKGEDEE